MTARDGIKIPAIVGVIASSAEMRTAARMRDLPDLFELRLDCLPGLEPKIISKLRRPLIITARHSAEGGYWIEGRSSATPRSPAGAGRVSSLLRHRSDLLLKFLPYAQFVDVELRSLRELHHVWKEAERFKIKRICSLHNFSRTPPHADLEKQFRRAKNAGADIFKLVTRADHFGEFITLLQFLCSSRGSFGPRGRSPSRMRARTPIECCVMAVGKFGLLSRLLFPECGSAFVYAPLLRALYPGQLTLRQLSDSYARTQARKRNFCER